MILLKLLFSLFFPSCLGYCVLNILFSKDALCPFLKLSISFGLGLGILAHWMFILAILGMPLNFLNITTPLLIIIFYLHFLHSRTQKKDPLKIQPKKQTFSNISLWQMVFLMYILYYCLFVFWHSLNIPVNSWDGIAFHAYDAKVIYYDQSILFRQNVRHATYPLFLPFTLSWVAFNLGTWDDQLIKIIFPCLFISFLGVKYYFLKYYTNTKWALAGLALIVSSNFLTYHATIIYRDFTLLYYNCLTITFLIFWNQKKSNSWIYLAAIFSGFGSFVKSEGLIYILIHLMIFISIFIFDKKYSWLNKLKLSLKFCLPSLAIALIFFSYKLFVLLPKTLSQEHGYYNVSLHHIVLEYSSQSLSRLFHICYLFFYDLFLSGNWNMLWFLLIMSLLRINKTRWIEVRTLLISLFLFLAFYIGGFSFTQFYIWITSTNTVLSRAILHFIPLVPSAIIFINYPKKS